MTEQNGPGLSNPKSKSIADRPNRRQLLKAGLATGLAAPTFHDLHTARAQEKPRNPEPHQSPPEFELNELGITALQERMQAGEFTARSVAEKYLERIAALDQNGPALRSVIEINPDALTVADALDQERKQRGPRGPLHGVPVLLKDNIDTADRMATTAGSLALVGAKPQQDAFIVRRLRAAGALILGKTNPSEWANIRSSHSTSGWSGRGGLTRNPYALDRNTSGSSSGSGAAVAANLCAIAVGTETDGSIISPSAACGVVGLKPTLGLVSRSGIIPIAHSQDTAGPMARTVRDAALLLGVLAGVDADDAATAERNGKAPIDYTASLDPHGLRGARIGVVRKCFGFHDATDALMADALDVLKREGALLVDPAEIETLGKFDEAELSVLLYELKADLNAYLARLGPGAPVHTLKEVIEFNERNKPTEMPYFGQDLFLKAESKGPLTTPDYIEALQLCRRMARQDGIDATMDKFKLDALVAPTQGPAWLTDLVDGDHSVGGGSTSPAAVAGYPSITVPAGFICGLPVGLSFFGRPSSEQTLLKMAYAFEQATKVRKPPKFRSTAG
ncbi:MAG: amidase [Deltaproteobacteria bacterium]|nr:amidase [Deltaproteobacteria bacterium]